MSKNICGHNFEKISEQSYRIIYPDGHIETKHYIAAESLMKKLQDNASGVKKIKATIYNKGEIAYTKLEAITATLNAFIDTHEFAVSNCMLDANSGTGWTTILCKDKSSNMPYMLFTPIEQEEILNAPYTEFSKIISKFISKLKKDAQIKSDREKRRLELAKQFK